MLSRFKNIIEQSSRFGMDTVVILACSGGVDSMVMLDLFQRYAKLTPAHLVVAHINHHLRDSADEDEEFLRDYANEQGLEFLARDTDVKSIAEETSQSVEMAARQERYKLLESIREEKDGEVICTAHTKSDQAETVLMRIIHGTGVHGAQGIRRQRGNIFRPLLDFTREEIETSAADHDIPFREDPSNTDQSIERNWVRHTLIPLIADEMNPNVMESLAHFASVQSEVARYMDSETEKALETLLLSQSKHEIILDIRGLRNYFTALQKNIILRCLTDLRASKHAISYPRMAQITDILIEGDSGQKMTLPGGIFLVRDREQALITDRDWKDSFERKFRSDAKLSLGRYTVWVQPKKNVTDSELKSSNEWDAYFDREALAERDLVWRTWEDGDTMQLSNGTTKKLSDIWIDTKTPLWEKHQLPLLAEGANILWIPGVKRSGFGWITDDSKEYLKISVRRTQ
ncbi:MAG: tRNA(Ile)-lysidine synthase [Candidatus Marinimicrobia bacterium]|nr:tRNA(Ile)-lysidine synthase [Candidatus Neomarinimicrobiota bacterium]